MLLSTYQPLPEVTRVEFVAYFETVQPENYESSTTEDNYFLSQLEKTLQSYFPNAELWLYLDASDYSTRKQCRVWVQSADDETYDDDNTPDDIYQETYNICEAATMQVGAEVYITEEEPPDPDSWEDGSDQPMPWELADDEKY